MRRLVECVPNFSEGRDFAVVEEIVRAIQMVKGVVVLDREMPFVPLEGVEMTECIEIARRTGEEIWRRCRIPVYYYEAAARDPERVNLEKIRKGQFEGLREEVKTNPARRPDVGGPELHPTAGATVVGARKFLIAYNIYLATGDVEIAKRIARKIRASSGGMPFVKAMGVEVKGRAQVSLNLTDFEQTPVHLVFDAVGREAAAEGTSIESSEIIGLIPRKAWEMAGAWFLKAENFHSGLVIENRVAEAPAAGSAGQGRPGAAGLTEFLNLVAAPTAVPGGGSAAAAAAALAASLGLMVAGLAAKKKDMAAQAEKLEKLTADLRKSREFLEQAVWRDAESYEAVRAAYRLPKEQREGPVETALQGAAAVPLEVAEAVGAMKAALRELQAMAPAAMKSDLLTAEALAEAALKGARANVEINLEGIGEGEFRRRAKEILSALVL
ncbi:MAG: cyclodeaminase/cyclohydrolase family protein [Acidobacteria bacterium]|nr:cyclodeaminase/cyclohydrolase family protein [Acidobacteriota bacterium]